jgi:hypothetical protein
MRWAGHVTSMEEMRNADKILVGNLSGVNYSEDRGACGEKILVFIIGK